MLKAGSATVCEDTSGLYPVWYWKSLRMKTAQPLQVTCVPCLAGRGGKNVSPHLQSEHLLFLLVPAAYCPSTMHHCEEPGSTSLLTPSQTLGAAVRSPQSLLFSMLDKPQSLSCFLHGKFSSPDHCGSPPLNSPQYVNVFLVFFDIY